MSLDDFFQLGETVTIGTFHFDPDSIVAFARKYDPQPFHLSEEAAKGTVFGRLCASGWHTAAAWMKCNVSTGLLKGAQAWNGEGPAPTVGASPGFRNLKWLKPVYAGETVTYTRKVLAHRLLASRPGYRVLTVWGEGHDSTGDKVLEFESAVIVKSD
ncbi:MAG: MaoC family dehydratase [Rhizobiaceae bacterium]|nr:MaoC family dehydratase [Rhizobiaceae bacterium]